MVFSFLHGCQVFSCFSKIRLSLECSCFCFYNSRESYVCGKVHSGSGYIEGGQIYVHKDIVHLKSGGATYTLSRNGYWDGKREVNYDYEYFDKFGVVKDIDTDTFKSFSGKEYAKGSVSCNYIDNYLQIGDIRIYAKFCLKQNL